MVRLTFYTVQNDEGQALLETYVRPLCERLNIYLDKAPANATRAHSLAAQITSDILLWDGSVGPEHAYHAMNDWVKHSDKHIIVSRTPLPRNVLARHQCVPIHGERFENDVLHEWLEKWLISYVKRKAGQETNVDSVHFSSRKLADHYWLDNPADIFLSYRGSQEANVAEWHSQFTAKTGKSVRIVPKQQYAYETECVTRQHMWEVVACLFHEMHATKTRVIFHSDDYYNSFWTCSEFLTLLNWSRDRDIRTYTIVEPTSTTLRPLEIETPMLTRTQSSRFWRILNNSDPLTSAPDTQVSPSGPAKAIAFLFSSFGYYNPEFTGAEFWKMVRVPCLHCQPKNRKANSIDWDEHLKFASNEMTDYYGYFSVSSERLQTGNVICPRCNNPVKLKNVRPPRTLWMPIMTTEKDQHRPVLIEEPLWEVYK